MCRLDTSTFSRCACPVVDPACTLTICEANDAARRGSGMVGPPPDDLGAERTTRPCLRTVQERRFRRRLCLGSAPTGSVTTRQALKLPSRQLAARDHDCNPLR